MTIQEFNRAKDLMEQIHRVKCKRNDVEKMKKRNGDADFNLLRETAHEALSQIIYQLETEFKTI